MRSVILSCFPFSGSHSAPPATLLRKGMSTALNPPQLLVTVHIYDSNEITVMTYVLYNFKSVLSTGLTFHISYLLIYSVRLY